MTIECAVRRVNSHRGTVPTGFALSFMEAASFIGAAELAWPPVLDDPGILDV